MQSGKSEVKIMKCKKWYKSRTLWANAVAIIVIVVQYLTDKSVIDVQAQAMLLAIANIILRSITDSKLEE